MGLQNHQIHEADDVCIVRSTRFRFLPGLLDLELITRVAADERVDHLGGAAVMALERELDLFGGRHHGVHFIAGKLLGQGVDGIEIKRVLQRDAKVRPLQTQRHCFQPVGQLAWNGIHGLFRHSFDAFNEVHAGLGGLGAEDVVVGNEPPPDQLFHRAVFIGTGGATCVLQIGGLNEAMLQKQLHDEIVVGGHGSFYVLGLLK